MIRYAIPAFVAVSLITGTAVAQTPTAMNRAASDAATVVHKDGEWRASKLAGVNVYNAANEKIGDINDVILDKSGKAASVVLAVGGFLGMGEHYVAVSYDKLKWINEPVRSTTTSDGTAARPTKDSTESRRNASDNADRTTGAASNSKQTTTDNWYPDHVVYNATKDQLKAMPQFKY